MYISAMHADTIRFGKCDAWDDPTDPNKKNIRSYSLSFRDRTGEYHEVKLYVDRHDIVPTIESQITNNKCEPIGDWLTDSIDCVGLELPPMPDESDFSASEDTDGDKLIAAVVAINDVAGNMANSLNLADRQSLRQLALRIQKTAQAVG